MKSYLRLDSIYWYALLIAGIALLPSCQAPHSSPDQHSMNANPVQLVDQNIAFIYDYDTNKTRLEFRAVKLAKSTGDPLKDALYALCTQTNLAVDFKQLNFNQKLIDEQVTQFVVAGHPVYQSIKDSVLFHQALDMTIARHHNNLDYQIVMLDQ